MPISLPNVSVKRQLARKLSESIVSLVPGGGPLVALFSVTHPGKGEVQLAQWREELTAFANSLEERVDFLTKSIALSEDAASLGKWVAEQSEDGGRFDLVRYNEISREFEDATEIEIQEAIGELELNDLVSTTAALGKPILTLRPKPRLFEIFDPIVFTGVFPREDAAAIASELLQSEGGVHAADLSQKFGWSIRRLNPAMAIVGQFIADQRKSSPTGQPYIIRSMFVSPSERAKLRNFVKSVSPETNSSKGVDQ